MHHSYNHRLFSSCVVAAFSLAVATSLFSQEPAQPPVLHVVVHESADTAVTDAIVYLQTQEAIRIRTDRTDARGNCSFANLRAGFYTIRVEKNGYTTSTTSLSLAANEIKEIDVTLNPPKTPPSQPTPEFFDQPHFTVSGVTDTTSVGGHGSDAVARTRESLAKDTATLGTTASSSPSLAEDAALREKAEHNPASFTANRDLGKVLLQEGKPAEAVVYLERAERLSHSSSEQGQSRQDQPQRDHPPYDRAELHHLVGSAEEKLGRALDAVHEYQRAAELDPSEAYFFDWGSELLLHHAPEPALEVFTKGVRLFPQSARMLMGLGAAWFASGSFDQAVHLICQASDLNPADPVPYQFLAKMQSTQTLTSDELIDRLRRFATEYPENAAANYYYAVSLWKQGKNRQDSALIAQVDSLLETAIRINSNFSPAHLQLGILHSEQKDFSRAITDYQHALQANPQSDFQLADIQVEEAHYRLAQAYREMGETAKAKTELQIYEKFSKQSAQRAELQRREIGQFVYTLRDQPSASVH